jgi:hypothetical protein
MKPVPFALFILALVVAMAWPLSSAIGSATAASGAIAQAELRTAACVPEQADAAPTPEQMGLPPGHPPISARGLPPGHPPIPGRAQGLPPGHPPIPSGHPPVPASPTPLFGEPVLLNI